GATDQASLYEFSVVVVDSGRNVDSALAFSRQLHDRRSKGFVPILFITGDHSSAARLASLEAGADTYLLRPFAPQELLAQVQAFLRWKEMQARLMESSGEGQRVNQRLQE